MQQLVTESGKRMVMKKKRIFELAGEGNIPETSADSADIVAFVDALGKTQVHKMKVAELRQRCSMYFPDVDLDKMKKSDIISLILETYKERTTAEYATLFTDSVVATEAETLTSPPQDMKDTDAVTEVALLFCLQGVMMVI